MLVRFLEVTDTGTFPCVMECSILGINNEGYIYIGSANDNFTDYISSVTLRSFDKDEFDNLTRTALLDGKVDLTGSHYVFNEYVDDEEEDDDE